MDAAVASFSKALDRLPPSRIPEALELLRGKVKTAEARTVLTTLAEPSTGLRQKFLKAVQIGDTEYLELLFSKLQNSLNRFFAYLARQVISNKQSFALLNQVLGQIDIKSNNSLEKIPKIYASLCDHAIEVDNAELLPRLLDLGARKINPNKIKPFLAQKFIAAVKQNSINVVKHMLERFSPQRCKNSLIAQKNIDEAYRFAVKNKLFGSLDVLANYASKPEYN